MCRYFFLAPKFYTYTILHFWVTTCQGMVQYANRYTKASKGVLADSLLDSFLQNHNSVPLDCNFDFKFV